MKLKDLLILPLTAALIGCGGGAPKVTEEQAAQNSASEAEALAANPGEVVGNPMLLQSEDGDAPAPGAPMAATAENTGLGGFDKPDPLTGKERSVQEALQAAVENYSRMQATSVIEPNQKGWPDLTSLEDLVKYRMISRIPDAPDGKKWTLNEKKEVVLE